MFPIALAAAGLVARLCVAARPAAAVGAPADLQVEADSVRYDAGTGRVLLEGHALLRRGAIVLRARSATYDPATGEARAAGGVLLTDATHVVAADAVRAVLGGDVEADGVVAFVKDQPLDLAKASTLEGARRAGRNRLSISGAHLNGDLSGRFRLDAARLTLCDCGEGRLPSWEVSAREADVIAGRRAILHWAVLRVTPPLVHRQIPILASPWLFVPLGERQTGLLLPEIRSTGATGLTVGLPLFVTLGRSADATLTPEYAFGRADPDSDAARRDGAVRGPGARLELRWAPAPEAEGRAELSWLLDLDGEAGGERGSRFALDAAHAQRLGNETTLRSTLRLSGDPVWVRDMAGDVNGRATPYGRSDVLVSRAGDAVVVEAGASYLQPFLPGGLFPGVPYGPLGADQDISSRWPAVAATVPPLVAGPLRLSGRAGLARYAPVSAATDQVSRPAADRADARAELALPLVLGAALSLAPYARGAAVAYAFEAARDPRASAWGVAGMVASSELSRRFGELRHTIAPRVEWRAGTAAAGGDLAWAAYDPFDRSAAGPPRQLLPDAPGTFHQMRAALETRLVLRGAEVLRAEVGQEVDLAARRLAETFTSASVAAGRFSAGASARFFPDGRGSAAPAPDATFVPSRLLDRLSELTAGAALSDARGDNLHAGFFSVGAGGSGRLVASLEPLFDTRAAALGASAFATAGARLVAGTGSLGYDALLYGRAQLVASCSDAGAFRRVEGWDVHEHVARLEWSSPCRCFRIAAFARVNDCGALTSYGASIDLSQLAAARVR